MHAHNGGEYIANHCEQKDFLASVFIRERSYVWRYDELKRPEKTNSARVCDNSPVLPPLTRIRSP